MQQPTGDQLVHWNCKDNTASLVGVIVRPLHLTSVSTFMNERNDDDELSVIYD